MSDGVVIVDRRAWFVRLYAWLWGASAEDITVCKLFWAYVFAPLALFVFKPLRFVLRRNATGKALGRIDGAAARHPRVMRALSYVWLVYVVAILYLLVFGFITDPVATGAALGGCVLLVLAIHWLVRSSNRALRLAHALDKFGSVLLSGYHAVKTRTCPRIEVR